mmetsp:Transcript_8553/g.22066  ORF Transcript_8553/g.22066 Transcript_8553/m.22066 type:complete len:263 (-) Transcript_8553:72-860(-)
MASIGFVKNTFIVIPEEPDADDFFFARTLRRCHSDSDVNRVDTDQLTGQPQRTMSVPFALSAFASQSKAVAEERRVDDDAFRVLEGCSTVMVHSLPKQVSQDMLARMVHDNGFLGAYDFLYVPMDSRSRANKGSSTNRGFAFVDLLTPDLAKQFYKAFNNRHVVGYESCKPLEVRKARLQGFDQLAEYFASKSQRQQFAHSTSRPIFLLPGAPRSPEPPRVAEKEREPRAMPRRGPYRFCPYCGSKRTPFAETCHSCGLELD